MSRKRISQVAIIALTSIAIGWTALTLYVEKKGPAKQWTFGDDHEKTALIVYDPDPFYNLDEQVCFAFGEALAKDRMKVTVATVAAAEEFETESYDILVYCANTYNWRPDWAITNFIKEHKVKQKTPVVAITLGA